MHALFYKDTSLLILVKPCTKRKANGADARRYAEDGLEYCLASLGRLLDAVSFVDVDNPACHAALCSSAVTRT